MDHPPADTAPVAERQGWRRPPVQVPTVVGMTVEAGRRAAGEAEVVLAPPDPDGPGLAGLLWPHEAEYVITSQSPAGGSLLRQHDSVVVTYTKIDADGPEPDGGQGAAPTATRSGQRRRGSPARRARLTRAGSRATPCRSPSLPADASTCGCGPTAPRARSLAWRRRCTHPCESAH